MCALDAELLSRKQTDIYALLPVEETKREANYALSAGRDNRLFCYRRRFACGGCLFYPADDDLDASSAQDGGVAPAAATDDRGRHPRRVCRPPRRNPGPARHHHSV